METSNLKSGKLSFSEGRFALLGGGQKIFIFRGVCPIRGFNFLGGLYPLCILLYSAGKATLLRGGCNSGEWGAYFYIQGVSSEGHSLLHGRRINKIGPHSFVARPTLTLLWKTLIYIIYNSKFVYRLLLMKKVKVKLPPQSGCSPEAVEPHP